MRLESLEHFHIDPVRLAAAGTFVGLFVSISVWVSAGPVLGSTGPEVELIVGALAFYLVVTVPKRALYSERVAQARESVMLSEAASALSVVTGSRTRAMLGLKAGEPSLDANLTMAKRRILLGSSVDEAARIAASGLASYSAAGVLTRLADTKGGRPEGEAVESAGMSTSAAMDRETKLPIFMTVCFFAPVVMILYSSFFRVSSLEGLSGLLFFEAVVLDLAFQVCSVDRRAA